ncbi:MAG: hypothetical protein HQ513_13425 [Rhodospirillales bacterium]|nr:hypothetical protein [Rhodospirillales bacterium]
MSDNLTYSANRWQRFSDWHKRPLRLDQFAVEYPFNGSKAAPNKAALSE